jgi:hypothetical protein
MIRSPSHSVTPVDLLVIGAGPSGMMAAIAAARNGARVLLLEKQAKIGAKLQSSGGGRCNLTNTLPAKDFMAAFGREGRFMIPALRAFDRQALLDFLAGIGVPTHAPDGFRVFPVTHEATTVVEALTAEMRRLSIEIIVSQRVERLVVTGNRVTEVITDSGAWHAPAVVIATGGRGYPALGAEGDGYALAIETGHTVIEVFPAMLPLKVREPWVQHCRADTIGKAELRVNLPKERHRFAVGDLIFTTDGIRGPVVLDFAREITPLLARHGEVPLLVNFRKGRNEDEVRQYLQKRRADAPHEAILNHLGTLLPEPLACQLCQQAGVDPTLKLAAIPGAARDRLIKLLVATPLTVIGHDGWNAAMITRGGVSLKEVSPETLESRRLKGLFFCGELLNLDGPCGGFNLQWAFSSGFLAGTSSYPPGLRSS